MLSQIETITSTAARISWVSRDGDEHTDQSEIVLPLRCEQSIFRVGNRLSFCWHSYKLFPILCERHDRRCRAHTLRIFNYSWTRPLHNGNTRVSSAEINPDDICSRRHRPRLPKRRREPRRCPEKPSIHHTSSQNRCHLSFPQQQTIKISQHQPLPQPTPNLNNHLLP